MFLNNRTEVIAVSSQSVISSSGTSLQLMVVAVSIYGMSFSPSRRIRFHAREHALVSPLLFSSLSYSR